MDEDFSFLASRNDTRRRSDGETLCGTFSTELEVTITFTRVAKLDSLWFSWMLSRNLSEINNTFEGDVGRRKPGVEFNGKLSFFGSNDEDVMEVFWCFGAKMVLEKIEVDSWLAGSLAWLLILFFCS